MRKLKLILMALTVAGLFSACTAEPPNAPSNARSNAPSKESPNAPSKESLTDSSNVDAEVVVQRFLDAANSGDEAAVAALFAEDARFDSVGRIYPNRQEIMDRFLVPEVLRAGGRYEAVGQRWDGDRLTVTYRFTTRSGAQERFTYAYLVRDGLIRDVVGRYV